jgi:HEAT repeat protein
MKAMQLPKETIINALKKLDRGNPFEKREAKITLKQFNEDELLRLLEKMAWDVDIQSSLAMWALPTLSQEKGIPILCNLARHENTEIRINACGYLGNYKDPRGIPTLIERLDDEAGEVRGVAIFSLSKIGDERAIPKLQYLAETDTWEDHEDINKNRAAIAITEIQNGHILPGRREVPPIPKMRFSLPDRRGFRWNP